MTMIESADMLINGLQTQFTHTYRDIKNRESSAALKLIVDTDSITADNRKKEFGYRESAPGFDEWKRHESITSEGMSSNSFMVEAFKWGKRLKWLRDDREDDQTQSLFQDAQATARSMGLHAELMYYDAALGTTNKLPYVPNAPDGLPMFDSGTRFGTSGGNVETTYDVATTSGVLTGFHNARARLARHQDTKGEPLWTDAELDGGILFQYSSQDDKVVKEAFRQVRQAGASGSTPSNLLLDINADVTLWGTSRLPSGTALMYLTNTPVPVGFVMNRTPLEELSSMNGSNNSDLTAETDIEWVQWRFRAGYGVNVPYGAIKLT